MQSQPSSEIFHHLYQSGKAQIVWTSLVSDLETPISAYLKLANSKPYSFLLESVVSGTRKDRYSFIGLNPDIIWKCKRDACSINRNALNDLTTFEKQTIKPIDAVRALMNESRIDIPALSPTFTNDGGFPPLPMSAGLFGYLGYDMIRQIEAITDTKPDQLNLDDAILMRPSLIAAFDSIDNRITFITPVYPQKNISANDAYAAAQSRLQQAVTALAQDLPAKQPVTVQPTIAEPQSNTSREKFYDMVNKAKEYIHAGDIFQVVLSQRFSMPFSLPPFALYRSLRRLNPSPFLFFLNLGEFQLVGSSPEILVRLRDDVVTIRPIAGTRPRGSGNHTDAELAADLLADPKERSEHLMLLDLGRNDVGRVAKVGSVKVTEQFQIELYSHVMHIVSNVEGKISDRCDALDALFAGFPAGTVSGAPKVRAMQIIDELEVARRGPYGGCVGYFGANGSLDTCIALRTAIVKDGTMYVQAGGGVVSDSDPAYEYNESQAKARALIKAAEQALREA
ncbi:MAG: anthranilate synthase component I [Alphaproteobacteria bacterium]|nr:anthranilate synthase component I [Alphaproteobacteria bacterium]